MNADFTIEELDTIHLSLITRERVIRKEWIPCKSFADRVEDLTAEADALRALSLKVCAAKLSKELGFDIGAIPA